MVGRGFVSPGCGFDRPGGGSYLGRGYESLLFAIYTAIVIRNRAFVLVSRAGRGFHPAGKVACEFVQRLQPGRLFSVAAISRLSRLHRWPRPSLRPAAVLSRLRSGHGAAGLATLA